ncbi:hypothetical protein ACWGDS_39410 [Streptomyces sp. NPDC055059]
MWAARLWWMLRPISVPVAVLDGGWQAWEAGGHPIAHGDERDGGETSATPVTRPLIPSRHVDRHRGGGGR